MYGYMRPKPQLKTLVSTPTAPEQPDYWITQINANTVPPPVQEFTEIDTNLTEIDELVSQLYNLRLSNNEVRLKITIPFIKTQCCKHFGFSEEDMGSDLRGKDLVAARHAAFYITRRITCHSFPRIGRQYGDRDHTTVLHGVRKMTARLKTEPNLCLDIQKILKTIAEEVLLCR